ncbi:unnamed protein product [Adineta ricciae]|uniref:Uncharacterized protein n=1 Tax=Adineta ricciae TaxID=249248 RepID=A0A815WX26_ADIRI|nr:unnamed protein product [Adineta ricciae]CAF1640635.1 unnamed protein product [Adineta ricciae]
MIKASALLNSSPSPISSGVETMNADQGNDDDGRLTLDTVLSTSSGHKKCVACRIDVSSSMETMPKLARLDLLVLTFSFCIVFLLLLILIQESQLASYLDFDNRFLTDEDYEAWRGWTIEQFDQMFDQISMYLHSSYNRTSRNAFAIFWIKVKTNLSFRQIDSLFNFDGDMESRQRRTAEAFDSVAQLMLTHFVPNHLSIGHITQKLSAQSLTGFKMGNTIQLEKLSTHRMVNLFPSVHSYLFKLKLLKITYYSQ